VHKTIGQAINVNFLGNAPNWYKFTVMGFLVLNPILFYTAKPFLVGWIFIGEFIFSLALALKCYPLPPGGLLALQAVLLGMTSPKAIYSEVAQNLAVILEEER
jgi:Na+:H+ antiporter, NhaB family